MAFSIIFFMCELKHRLWLRLATAVVHRACRGVVERCELTEGTVGDASSRYQRALHVRRRSAVTRPPASCAWPSVQLICLAGTCGPKASSCVCCTFITLHHRAKHVHHALGAAVDAAASLAYAQGHARSWAAPPRLGCASGWEGPKRAVLPKDRHDYLRGPNLSPWT